MANYAEHHASVIVNASVHQVYALFSHFNDFPKFMSFVKEVTYADNQHSHWVAEVAGRHEWDAVNENWVSDQQIGWHSTNGLDNFGKVTFEPSGSNQTRVDVYVSYDPPIGVLGDIGEKLGAGGRFENALQSDLTHFARMVDEAPAGALDPNSSNYLFHSDSAATKGTTTQRQNETMYNDPNQPQNAEGTRVTTDRDITGATNEDLAMIDSNSVAPSTSPYPTEPTRTNY
jgi:uncharacterized membrane protein